MVRVRRVGTATITSGEFSEEAAMQRAAEVADELRRDGTNVVSVEVLDRKKWDRDKCNYGTPLFRASGDHLT